MTVETKFAHLFSPLSAAEASRAAAARATSAVQMGLWRRLRGPYGPRAGSMAWALIRLSQPDHDEFPAAVRAMRGAPPAERAKLVRAASASREAVAGRSAETALLDRILDGLRRIGDPEIGIPDLLTPEERAELDALLERRDRGPRASELIALVKERQGRVVEGETDL